MEIKNLYAQDSQGNAQPDIPCYLYYEGTETLVTGLVDANNIPKSNPFNSDVHGLIQFKAPNGVYDLRVVSSVRDYRIRIQCVDPTDAIGAIDEVTAARDAAIASATNANTSKTSAEAAASQANAAATAAQATVNSLALPDGSTKIGYGSRTQEQKNKDVLSVRDYITSTIDGVTSNQAGIQAAVSAAKARGCDLYWPSYGIDYVTTGSIIDFHSVTHRSDGAWLKRGTTRYKINNDGDNRNILYVSPTGTGDGLADTHPASLTSAFDYLKSKGPVLGGRWRISLAAGTYAPVTSRITGFAAENYVEVFGPAVNYGVPTAIIDAANTAWGLYFTGTFSVWFKDIKGINATGGSVASAFVCDNMNICFADNVHTYNTQWAGVNANNCSRLIAYGGVYENSATSGLKGYGGTLLSIGRVEYRPRFINCQTGVAAQGNAYGHIDYCDYIGCATGVEAIFNVHVSNYNSTFTNCTVMSECDMSSTINNDGYTVTNTPTLMRSVGSPSYFNCRYENQFFPFSGVNGRSSYGYNQYTVPNVKYQYSNGSSAGFNLSGMAACTALWESNANTIIGLAAPDANYSSIWFANSTSPRHSEIRASAGSLIYLFNSVSAFSMNSGRFVPSTDNDKLLGNPALRWSVLYAGTGTINTSDERSKQQLKPIDDACLRAWAKVEYVQYKFNDAVEQKGDDEARWHFGVIAQRVKDAFESEGLDAFEYGLLCYDEWDEQAEVVDEDGTIRQVATPAGNRFGIRYEEALALESAWMRSVTEKLQQRIEDLESRLAN